MNGGFAVGTARPHRRMLAVTHSVTLVVVLVSAACPAPASPPDAGALEVELDDAGVRAEPGAPCTQDSDCTSGLCGGLSTCGVNECPIVGDRCDDARFCVGGPCDRSCELPLPRGATCRFFSDDNPCGTTATCADGLLCVGPTEDFAKFGTGLCLPAAGRAAGERCRSDEECASLACGPLAACLGAIDDACAIDDECASGLCGGLQACAVNACPVVGDACDDATFCAGGPCGRSCATPGQRGDACAFFSDDSPCATASSCAAGLLCGARSFGKFGDGACVPAVERSVGEPCGDDGSACAAGLLCEANEQSCR